MPPTGLLTTRPAAEQAVDPAREIDNSPNSDAVITGLGAVPSGPTATDCERGLADRRAAVSEIGFPAGSLSDTEFVSAAGQDAQEPQIAVNPTGAAAYVWRRFDGTSDIVQGRVRATNGTLGAIQGLSVAGQNATSPQVAIAPNGDGTNWIVQARARTSTGTLSTTQTLSPPPGPGFHPAWDPDVAVDSNGHATFTWDRDDGTRFVVQTRRRTLFGELSDVQNLSR